MAAAHTHSIQNTLSIRLGTDGFSFSIYNPLLHGPLVVERLQVDPTHSLTANLREVFSQTEALRQSYRRVNVLVTGKRYTTVPLELFSQDQAEALFYCNQPHRENERVCHNLLQHHSLALLFGIDRSAHAFLAEQHPQARFYAQVTPLISHFATRSRLGNSRKMYVSLRCGAADVFCFERGHQLLVNSFECGCTADRIYYLLYVWKQLELDQVRDELHLTGDVADKENLIAELRKFLRQVFVMHPATDIDMQAIQTCE